MAFQTGTSSSIENLMTQLSTFLQANGWIQDHYTAGDGGRMGLHKNTIYVAFQWGEATSGGILAVYQSTSNSDATSIWLSTGDSGAGYPGDFSVAYAWEQGRCVNQFAGPHAGYYFFENDAAPAYCHVVVEVNAGRFRHLGFGECEKIGTWTGGEYCYGHYWGQATSWIDSPATPVHDCGMEAYGNTGLDYNGTMRVEGYPNEPSAATVWANMGGANQTTGTSKGNDRAGNPRWIASGPWRMSREFMHLMGVQLSPFNAFKPICPMPIELINAASSPAIVYRVGYQVDVRMCNIANLTPGQVINIAGDNWYFFPWVRKQFLQNDTEESWDGGVAYRRVDA